MSRIESREELDENLEEMEKEIIEDKYSNNFETLEDDPYDFDSKTNLKKEKRSNFFGFSIINPLKYEEQTKND